VSKQEHEDVFEDFITFVGKFCTGKSYQRLKTIAEDNDTLRKQLEDTKTAYGRNMEELTQRTAAWGHEKETFEKKILEQSKQHRKAADEKATVDRKLKAEQDAAAGLKEQIKKLENDARRLIANSKKHEERVVNLEHDIEGQNKQLEAARKEKAKLKDEIKSTSDRLGAQSEVLSTAERKLEMFQSYTAALTSLDDVRESM
jgi:chromosome segregation ATPase